ncbi:MAG: 16S rRNA (guanine(966)-N(2))-methyltransferase RsmD [Thermodesulfobacteriota bacterium]|nr:16S rRNA (guanine(966)-N(2))-methyltransferase RsmD [Thermodesulfobacteriota bacterium]
MGIRICSGTYRSRRIECPSSGVRPTTDRVKEAIFSSLGMDFAGLNCLDLFSGSGSLGIEALSRGARHVVFVDSSKKSIRVIEKNLAMLKARDHSRVIWSDAARFIKKCPDRFDCIFMDPPYNKGLASQTIHRVYQLLNTQGILVIEHSRDEKIDIESFRDTGRSRVRTYGKTVITYLEKGIE